MSSLAATTSRPARAGVRTSQRSPVAGAERAHRVHLTRRGRALLLLVLVSLLYAAFAVGRSASEAAVTTAPAPVLGQLTVQSGDTLWGIARQVAPGRDPRPTVEQLVRLNDLHEPALQVGQQLLLPTTAVS